MYRFQWYHGTLDRIEANNILMQYAKNMVATNKSNVNENDVKSDKNEVINIISSYLEQLNNKTFYLLDDKFNIRCFFGSFFGKKWR